MTTYKGINGFAVQSVASDPSPLDEGQVWYNNATYAFKLAGIQAAAFSSGGNMNTGRQGLAGAGTQTSTVAFGGNIAAPSGPLVASVSATEIWNGTSWTSNPNSLATSRYGLVGFGTQSSGLGSGGYTGTGYSTSTEEWTGTALATRTITTS